MAATRSIGTRSCWPCSKQPTRRARSGTPRRPTWIREPYGAFEGKTIFEAAPTHVGPEGPQVALGYLPTDAEWRHPNIHEDTAAGGSIGTKDNIGGSAQLPEHRVWFFHLARICNHCTYPACLASCPRQAIYKRPEDGIVLIDQERCRGYRKCVEGCPYKKAMYRGTTRTSEKCVGCYPTDRGEGRTLSADGAPAETRCMSACVGKIRLQGLVAIAEDGKWAQIPTNPLYYLIRERQVALPLYPQFGTEPNGFYIPPRWVPRGYLHQMFGPGVDHALEQYSLSRPRIAGRPATLPHASAQILFRFAIEQRTEGRRDPCDVALGSGESAGDLQRYRYRL